MLGASASAATLALCGPAAASAATSLDVAAQCTFPGGGGVQPASFTLTFPEGLQAGDTAPGSVVSNFASPGLAGLGATVEFARNRNTVDLTYQGATTYGNPYFTGNPFPAATYLNGTLPVAQLSGAWLTYPQAGEVSATVTGLTLNLRAYTASGSVRTWFTWNDSDHNPETVDVPCTLDAGQTLSATFPVAPRTRPVDTTAPSAPGALSVSELTRTSAKISWLPSTDDQGVDHYTVIVRQSPNDAGIPVVETSGTSVTVNGLKRDTAYTVEVKAIDRHPNPSAAATAEFATRRILTDELFAVNLTGGATIATPKATASIPLSGTFSGTVTAATDELEGSLELAPSTITFTRTNGQTVTATATFTPAGATTGTQTHGPLRVRSVQNVTFGSVKLGGTAAIHTPSTCRLSEPAVLTLTSGDGVFSLSDGGTLSGALSLGRLTDCGAFGALVGPDLGSASDLWVSTTP